MTNIAVKGCTLELSPASSPEATVTITTPASTTTKADGNAVYSGPLSITIAGYTGGAITVAGSGATTSPAILQPGATKYKVDGKAVVLEGDSTTVVVTGLATAGTTTTTATQQVTIKIKSAGQSKCKAV